MTLINLSNYHEVVVDLTLPQCEMIQNLNLQEGNLITATLISAVSSIGQTEEWLLLKIDDVFRMIYNWEDIFPLIVDNEVVE